MFERIIHYTLGLVLILLCLGLNLVGLAVFAIAAGYGEWMMAATVGGLLCFGFYYLIQIIVAVFR